MTYNGTECTEHPGYRDKRGYGVVRIAGKNRKRQRELVST